MVTDNYVKEEEGTGVVHQAPYFGAVRHIFFYCYYFSVLHSVGMRLATVKIPLQANCYRNKLIGSVRLFFFRPVLQIVPLQDTGPSLIGLMPLPVAEEHLAAAARCGHTAVAVVLFSCQKQCLNIHFSSVALLPMDTVWLICSYIFSQSQLNIFGWDLVQSYSCTFQM